MIWKDIPNFEVLEIYKLAHSGDFKQTEIAEKYNINQSTVSKIKLGFTGRRVTNHISKYIDGDNGRKK